MSGQPMNPAHGFNDDSKDYSICNYVDKGVLGFSDALVRDAGVTFLVSMAAPLNFIKKTALRDDVVFDSTDTISVVDILGSQLRTLGSVKIIVNFGSQSYLIKFHVLGEGFSIPESGILGSPFLTKHQVVLNIAKKKMILLKPNKLPVSAEPDFTIPICQPDTPVRTYCSFKPI